MIDQLIIAQENPITLYEETTFTSRKPRLTITQDTE
jgi:hypothetical protein